MELIVRTAMLMLLMSPIIISQDTWGEVGSWNGTGRKNTETFTVTSDEWKIRWDAKSDGPMTISIAVYDAAGKLVGVAASSRKPGKEETYMRKPAGRYYLEINSVNADWTVTVEHKK